MNTTDLKVDGSGIVPKSIHFIQKIRASLRSPLHLSLNPSQQKVSFIVKNQNYLKSKSKSHPNTWETIFVWYNLFCKCISGINK